MRPVPSGDGAERRQTFLFLQGHSSPLFAETADRLEAAGHRCLRINFNVGDWIFWRRPGGVNYRGRLCDLPSFIERFLDDKRVTDIVLLGEERPVHRPAAAAAARRGIAVCCVDMGYLRPDWLTVEKGGGGCNSHFPDDPDVIRRAAEGLPEPDFSPRYTHGFAIEAALDLVYNLPNVFLWFLYPHYRWHAIDHPLAEYAGWLRRMTWNVLRGRAKRQAEREILETSERFFLFPLQLETDFQLRIHSPFRSQRDAIVLVLEDFAENAPFSSRLVFKRHPLDNGLRDWAGLIRHEARRLGLAGRVGFLDGGSLDRLIDASAGIVTVNSTVGLQAIRRGRPVATLGVALYDVEGLVDRRSLAEFWREPKAPDPALASAFVRLLAAALQVRGDLFDRSGRHAAADAIAARLLADLVNEPGGYVAEPPRTRPVKAGCETGR